MLLTLASAGCFLSPRCVQDRVLQAACKSSLHLTGGMGTPTFAFPTGSCGLNERRLLKALLANEPAVFSLVKERRKQGTGLGAPGTSDVTVSPTVRSRNISTYAGHHLSFSCGFGTTGGAREGLSRSIHSCFYLLRLCRQEAAC